jgi:hypothetical protein
MDLSLLANFDHFVNNIFNDCHLAQTTTSFGRPSFYSRDSTLTTGTFPSLWDAQGEVGRVMAK